jgi:hypothetical protein
MSVEHKCACAWCCHGLHTAGRSLVAGEQRHTGPEPDVRAAWGVMGAGTPSCGTRGCKFSSFCTERTSPPSSPLAQVRGALLDKHFFDCDLG